MRPIDADAFAKRAYEVAYPIVHGINDHERGLTLTGIAQLLDEAPTIEPKRGRWLPHPTEREWDVCSACGIGCKRREYGVENGKEWVIEYGYQYCPSCGAKMESDYE